MHRDFTFQRRLIIGGVAALLLADAGLFALSLRLASAPKTPEQELARQTDDVKGLKADINRVEGIRKDLAKTVSDFNSFEGSFLPAGTGYSTVTAEVGQLAKKSGLEMQGISFHQAEMKGRPLLEIQMEAQVSGPYTAVVKFLNGLQRSQDVYAVDALALTTKDQGNSAEIRVSVHMRTYFRSET